MAFRFNPLTSELDIIGSDGGGGGGDLCADFTFASTSAAFEEAYSIAVPVGQVILVDISIVARHSNQTDRAGFKRAFLSYLGIGDVAVVPEFWHTLFTHRTSGMDIRYRIDGDTVKIDVKSAASGACQWQGRVCIIEAVAT